MAPPALARQKIDAYGFDWLIEQLEHGRSLRSIATDLGVSHNAVYLYCNADALHSARAEQAMLAGAEAYEQQAVAILDAAQQEIRDEPQIASSIVTLARERAQACWRAASVRNPARYSDKRTLDVSVKHSHDVAQLPTAELERMVQTLQLDNDTGEVSDH
jgi:hypothetical protein